MSHDSSSLAVVSFSCQSTVYFWFLFQGNNTNIRNFNVYGKIIRFQANFLPLKCLDAKNNKGIYPLSCVISAW